jgi:pimeloyl-ACP methyl ester carboxylesterase
VTTTKPTVVFLHGWGVDHTTLEPTAQFASSLGFKTALFDFPGFGANPEPQEPWGVEEYALWLLERLKSEFRNEQLILFGHSFGARVIIKLVAMLSLMPQSQKPIKIEKLILTGAAGIRPKRGISYYSRVLLYKTAKKLPIGSLKEKLSGAGSEDFQKTSGVMRGTFIKVVNEDLTNILRSNPYETLLIWGENDDATPLADGELMEKLMPNAGLAKIANAGHYAFLEQPGLFNAILNSYLLANFEM